MSTAFSVCKVIPLGAFAVVGLFFIDSRRLQFGALPSAADVSTAVLLAGFAYFGFDASTVLAGGCGDNNGGPVGVCPGCPDGGDCLCGRIWRFNDPRDAVAFRDGRDVGLAVLAGLAIFGLTRFTGLAPSPRTRSDVLGRRGSDLD